MVGDKAPVFRMSWGRAPDSRPSLSVFCGPYRVDYTRNDMCSTSVDWLTTRPDFVFQTPVCGGFHGPRGMASTSMTVPGSGMKSTFSGQPPGGCPLGSLVASAIQRSLAPGAWLFDFDEPKDVPQINLRFITHEIP